VRVVDFGIRGLDLTYALLDGYEAVVLLDAAPRGERPGTLYVLEVPHDTAEGEPAAVEGHGMDPVKVLRLAAAMGGRVGRLFVVGCEPSPPAEGDEMAMGLSDPVRTAVEEAIPLVESLVARLLRGETKEAVSCPD
jgi:hydrogenase maturation protease